MTLQGLKNYMLKTEADKAWGRELKFLIPIFEVKGYYIETVPVFDGLRCDFMFYQCTIYNKNGADMTPDNTEYITDKDRYAAEFKTCKQILEILEDEGTREETD